MDRQRRCLIFILPLAMLVYTPLKAQFNIGPKIGMNANKIVTDVNDIKSDDFKFGIVGGLFFTVGKDKWKMQPEVLISQRKGQFSYKSVGTTVADTSFINNAFYLQVPVLMGWRPFKPVRIQAGPALNGLLVEKIKLAYQDKEDLLTLDNSAYKEWKASFLLGAQIEITRVLIGLRYEYTFGKVFNNFSIPGTSILVEPESKSPAMFQFTLGYKLIPVVK